MAGVLVYIEREGDGPRSGSSPDDSAGVARPSLEALGEGRRIATELGAPLVAFAPAWGPDEAATVAGALGRCGADQVLTAPAGFAAPGPDWQAHGLPLCTAANRLPARLVLAADTPASRSLLPRVAARISGAFAPRASVERGPRGELVFTRPLYGAAFLRRLASDDIDFPVVATLCAGAYAVARGQPGLVRHAEFPGRPRTERAPGPEPVGAAEGDLETAAIVVAGGAGLDASGWDLVVDLARALDGEHGATAGLCRRGIAPPEREIGLGGRYVSPRTYIAVATSAGGDHLAAVAPDAEIVAVHPDPDAAIFRVAAYGIVAEPADALPRLIAAAEARSSRAVAP